MFLKTYFLKISSQIFIWKVGKNKILSNYFLRNIALTPAGIISNTFGYWLTCLVTMSPAVESLKEVNGKAIKLVL